MNNDVINRWNEVDQSWWMGLTDLLRSCSRDRENARHCPVRWRSRWWTGWIRLWTSTDRDWADRCRRSSWRPRPRRWPWPWPSSTLPLCYWWAWCWACRSSRRCRPLPYRFASSPPFLSWFALTASTRQLTIQWFTCHYSIQYRTQFYVW